MGAAAVALKSLPYTVLSSTKKAMDGRGAYLQAHDFFIPSISFVTKMNVLSPSSGSHQFQRASAGVTMFYLYYVH